MSWDGNLDDAIERITYAVHDDHQPVAFLLGSGVSRGVVPMASGFAEAFLAELGTYADSLRNHPRAKSCEWLYQEAARSLKARRGEARLTQVVRQVVQQARTSPATDPLAGWRASHVHALLAQLIARIPAERRGPIFTTNFDPLIEVALERQGIPATALAAPIDQGLNVAGMHGSLPVVHLHGYYFAQATLSTVTQLERERPGLEETLASSLARMLTIVIGYGGWEDSFTRALERLIRSGSLANLSGELLWMRFSVEPINSSDFGILPRLIGAPGVSCYAGIDAAELLARTVSRVGSGALGALGEMTALGWAEVPHPDTLAEPTKEQIDDFTAGAPVSWSVAKSAPTLGSSSQFKHRLERRLSRREAGVLLATGPTGEGKTIALMQAALRARETCALEDCLVLWREPGATPITHEFMDAVRDSHRQVVLCVDEADLDFEGISRARRNGWDGDVTWLLACHLHSATEKAVSALRGSSGETLDRVTFMGITLDDAERLIRYWQRFEAIDDDLNEGSIESLASQLHRQASADGSSSLFGATLDVFYGDQLVHRAEDLLVRLSRKSINGVSFADLLACIALLQDAWDQEGAGTDGLTLTALGALSYISTDSVLPLVLEPLGREASLSRVGSHVYLRHPVICEAMIDVLARKNDDLLRVGQMIGDAGARLRWGGGADRDSRPLALFSRRGARSARLAAGLAYLRGSPGFLEARVTYLAALRDASRLELASRWATGCWANIGEFGDEAAHWRGFLVEWSHIERELGHSFRALELALRSLSDERSGALTDRTVNYALLCLIAAADVSRKQGVGPANGIFWISRKLYTISPRAGASPGGLSVKDPVSETVVELTTSLRELAARVHFGESDDFRLEFRSLTRFVQRWDVRKLDFRRGQFDGDGGSG